MKSGKDDMKRSYPASSVTFCRGVPPWTPDRCAGNPFQILTLKRCESNDGVPTEGHPYK